MITTTSKFSACYRCEIHFTNHFNSLQIDVTHFFGKDFNDRPFNVYRTHVGVYSEIHAQFSRLMLNHKSFINFAIRKMIYDTLTEWHPSWSYEIILKSIQKQCFPKRIKKHFGNGTKTIIIKY